MVGWKRWTGSSPRHLVPAGRRSHRRHSQYDHQGCHAHFRDSLCLCGLLLLRPPHSTLPIIAPNHASNYDITKSNFLALSHVELGGVCHSYCMCMCMYVGVGASVCTSSSCSYHTLGAQIAIRQGSSPRVLLPVAQVALGLPSHSSACSEAQSATPPLPNLFHSKHLLGATPPTAHIRIRLSVHSTFDLMQS